ncbi:MAG: AbrB/MazE/SpoVT family DNA-binding domain-containing protein [Thermoplasmata archaeon]|nr:AbrB/MazE/SpoVT family DNA-binding domain-containing protein [Thermoplasmata archaeon]
MSEIEITRLSSKGQIVIPKDLRDLLDLREGELFAMYGEGNTLVLKKLEVPSVSEFEEILKKGSAIGKKKKISRKEILKAISELRNEGS